MSVLEVVREPEYQALSRLDAEGNALINNAQLVMHDGTVKVQFKNGRATVPHAHAHHVAKHPNIDVIGYEGGKAAAPAAPVRPASSNGEPDQRDTLIEAMQEQLAELAARLAAVTGAVPAGERSTPVPPAEEAAEPSEEVSDAVKAAMEHLAAEGESVPDVGKDAEPPADRSGFDAETADGQPRCQAAKADGTQCSNPASGDGSSACGLSKHQEQLA